jgi:NAD(P)-dependent dehydrogenase (short-subunit alcohol dehydrogenase family)
VGVDIGKSRVLVTGASSGIGAALAIALARHGATVGICARRADRLDEVLAACQAHSPDSKRWVIDLAELGGLDAFARQVDDELGGIDVLVNNAGIPKRRHVRDLTPEVVDQVMAINYASPVRLTLALLPRMLERGRGRVLNVSSIAARLGPPREAAYCASKAALTAWSESMRIDLDGTGVDVQVVNPGVIDTELFHLPDNEVSLADLPAEKPDDMAEAIIEHLRGDTFELWFPGWFKDVAAAKANDIDGFMAGSLEWLKQKEAAS